MFCIETTVIVIGTNYCLLICSAVDQSVVTTVHMKEDDKIGQRRRKYLSPY